MTQRGLTGAVAQAPVAERKARRGGHRAMARPSGAARTGIWIVKFVAANTVRILVDLSYMSAVYATKRDI